jgi:hypothetical protein
MPATGALSGTPASISARLVPHTVAMELEPFDSSDFRHHAHDVGEFIHARHHRLDARLASLPWPISRRLGEPMRPVSPTLTAGSCSAA